MHGARVPGVERIGDIVLPHLPCTPAGDVEELVVQREVDVGDERGNRTEALEHRRQEVRAGGLCRDVYDLSDGPLAVLVVPQPDRGREVLQADDDAGEAVGPGRVSWAGLSSSTIWYSAPRSSACRCLRRRMSHTCNWWP